MRYEDIRYVPVISEISNRDNQRWLRKTGVDGVQEQDLPIVPDLRWMFETADEAFRFWSEWSEDSDPYDDWTLHGVFKVYLVPDVNGLGYSVHFEDMTPEE